MQEQPVTPPAIRPLPAPANPPTMDSPAACQTGWLWGFAAAIERQARCITCVSPRFDDWPLDDPALLHALTPWLRGPQRQLRLLAASYDGLGLQLPRFERWRRDFAHAVNCWCCAEDMAPGLPTVLYDNTCISVRVFDAAAGIGRASAAGRTRLLLDQQIDVFLQRSERAWPVKTLGI